MSLFRRSGVPTELRTDLHADEAITAHALTDDGTHLAVTRRRLLVLGADGQRSDIPWWSVAKAILTERRLTLVPLDAVAELADGTMVVRDGAPQQFIFPRGVKLTDQVHARVRGSVVDSRRLDWPGAGGWVTTRKVAGIDGLSLQIRLDPAANPEMPGFLAAARQLGDELLAGSPSE